MKEREDKFQQIDKSDWDRGQWQGEPDESTWVDTESGYKVEVARSPKTGAYRFAVGVPKGHAAWGYAHAPGLAGFDAAMEPGKEDRGLWWFACRFDRDHHGRPAERMKLEMYRNIHDVQEAVWNLCRELKHFDDSIAKPASDTLAERQMSVDEIVQEAVTKTYGSGVTAMRIAPDNLPATAHIDSERGDSPDDKQPEDVG